MRVSERTSEAMERRTSRADNEDHDRQRRQVSVIVVEERNARG